MPTAILKIDGDTSGLARAFGDMRAQAKATAEAIKSSMAGAAAAVTAAAQRGGRAQRAESARSAAQSERDAMRSVAMFLRSEDQKRRAARMTAVARERAEQDATKIAREEAAKRGLSAEQEARVRQSTLERLTRAHEEAERRQTATTKREQAQRTREGREIGTGLRRGLNVGRDAALNVAREAHSQIQDARGRRAESEHTLNAAFYQAGIGGQEAAGMRARLQREIASGGLRGLTMEDVAGGLMAAQTQFSVLSGATPQERAQRLNEQVSRMAFARNTFQDPGEVLRVSGMLSQQGVRGADQTAALQSLTGMAQAGSIELSTLTSTALGPLMANIARTTNAGMTAAQRAAAVRSTTAETMAVGEIGAAAGLTPRDSLNALAKLRGSVTSDVTQSRLYDRLRGAHREDLAAQLFQTGPGGRHTLRDASPVSLMSSLVSGFGGDANAVSNVLAAGGPGAPMVMDAQQRRLIMAMASQTSGGETIAQHVATMQATGSRFGIGDIGRGAAMVEGEQQTALRSAEATRDNALTDNTSAIVNLSNAFATWSTANPITSSAIQSGGGLLGGVIGGGVFSRIGTALAGTSVGGLLTGSTTIGGTLAAAKASGLAALSGAGSLGATLAGSVGAAGAGTVGAVVTGSLAAGGAAGYGINRALGHNQQSDNPLNAAFYTEFARSVRDAVRDGIASAPITAAVSPVDAAHAAAQAPR